MPFLRFGTAVFLAVGSLRGDKANAFPVAPQREHRYIWVFQRQKVGETTFRLTEVEAQPPSAAKKVYRSRSQYRYEREGTSLKGEHEAYFDSSWRPIRFQSRLHYSGPNEYRSRQDQQGEVRDGKLLTTVVHNEDTRNEKRTEMAAPADAYLLLSQAVDHWAILVGSLLVSPTTYDVKVIYPDFVKVYEVRFLFEKEEPVDLGKAEKPLCRMFSFRSQEGQFAGRVWVDRRGRMVQHLQGDLRIYLEE